MKPMPFVARNKFGSPMFCGVGHATRGNLKMSMKTLLMTGAAVLALGVGEAAADCAQELSMLQSSNQSTGAISSQSGGESGTISKDGTHTPLETPAAGASANTQSDTGPASGTTTNAEGVTTTGDAAATTGATASASESSGAGTGAATGTTGSDAGTMAQGEVSKDGKTMPLAEGEGGGDPNLAMSGQDVQSQQQGGGTAATGQQTAAGASGSAGMSDALQRAEAALAAGNEAECMQAVEEAKRLGGG